MRQGLACRFLAARAEPASPDPALDTALADLLDRARARFPLDASDDALVDQLAVTAVLDGEPAAAIAALSAEIVLAAACVLGDPRAVAHLDREYGNELRILVSTIVGDRSKDVVQDVWARLLVARDNKPPRLLDYGGRGSLLTWLRVVAAREAISLLRKSRASAFDDDVLVGRLVASHDPGLALVRAQSAAEVKRAFEEAVTTLSVRERNLLRQHLLDGLTIDELGALYHVHRATASRWIASEREAVWTRTQRSLRDRLELSTLEIESLLRVVRDYLDLSLERVL